MRDRSGAAGFAQCAVNQAAYFFGSPFNGLVQIGAVVFQYQGLMAHQMGFQRALDVFFRAFLAAIFIAQMGLYPCDLTTKSRQGRLNGGAGPLRQSVCAFYVVIGMDLDLHFFLLNNATTLLIIHHRRLEQHAPDIYQAISL